MSKSMVRILIIGVVVVLVVVVVGGLIISGDDEEEAATTPDQPPIVACTNPVTAEADGVLTEPSGQVADLQASLVVDSSDEGLAFTGGAFLAGTWPLFITEKTGSLMVVEGPEEEPTVAVDLSSDVASDTNERGLLDVASSPSGDTLYVSFTATDGATTLRSYEVADGAVVASSASDLLVVDQPKETHNGGGLFVDPDGLLYLSLGDGGSASETDFEDWGNAREAQNATNFYGSILRIDPNPSDGGPYAIPPDNPNVGNPDIADEIVVYGARNPWRFSVDPATGDLWIGDVGQYCFEEITVVPAPDVAAGGVNLGWPGLEGQHVYREDAPPENVLPVVEFEHGADPDDPCSIVGGYVYRGSALAGLEGTYFFSDSCADSIFGLQPDGESWKLGETGAEVVFPVSFFDDGDGEIYVVSLIGTVSKLEEAS